MAPGRPRSKLSSTITSVPPAIGMLSGRAAFAASASSHVVGWMKSIVGGWAR